MVTAVASIGRSERSLGCRKIVARHGFVADDRDLGPGPQRRSWCPSEASNPRPMKMLVRSPS
jgi:hypothetical protein